MGAVSVTVGVARSQMVNLTRKRIRRSGKNTAVGKRLAATAVVAGLCLLSACTTFEDLDPAASALVPSNQPVTVDNTRSGRLARIGAAQHPRILASYGGEYSNPRLERMVAGIVGRLVTVSDNPSQVYQISILDTPLVNAFALPGGYLYVSRGLLALANDSDELAAVIAHEMAHVTADHGLQRQRKEAETGLANRVVTEVLGQSPKGRLALVRNQLDLARFSRIQELEADAIGIAAMGQAGFDAYAAADFQEKMAAFSDLKTHSASENLVDFLSTHPSTPQRINLALGHARNFGARQDAPPRGRDVYLSGIDGMLYGDKPDEGFLRGRVYSHPGLGITMEFPDGFDIENRAEAVVASRVSDGAAIRFDGVEIDPETPLTSYIASGWVEGLETRSIRAASINGLEAAIASARVGSWKFDITVIRTPRQVYRILTAAPLAGPDPSSVAAVARDTFRLLTESERLALKPLQVRLVTAQAGDTAASLSARMSGVERSLQFFKTFNGMKPFESVTPGTTYKIVTE